MSDPVRTRAVVFTAVARNLGRSAAVVNTALILAGSGKRVLVIDWSREAPGVAHYLERFGSGPPPNAAELGALLDQLTSGRTGHWAIERFRPPGSVVPVDVATAEHLDAGQAELNWSVSAAELSRRTRSAIDESAYDFVLVDTPTDPAPRLRELIASSVDHVLVMGSGSAQWAKAEQRLYEDVHDAATGDLRLMAVVSDAHLHRPAGGGPAPLPHNRFPADPIPGAGETPPVRIPYERDRAERRVLALLADPPDTEAVRAYLRLAERISGDAATAAPGLTPEQRAEYRRAFGLESLGEPRPVTVVHAWPDRRWADWVCDRLTETNADPRRAGPEALTAALEAGADPSDPPVLVVLVSRALLDGLPRRGLDVDPDAAVLLDVDERQVPEASRPIVTAGRPAEVVGSKLKVTLGLVDLPAADRNRVPPFATRYPGDPAVPVGNVALPVDHPFVGRRDRLTDLRDRLLERSRADVPYLLTGPAGSGKTTLAQEYVRRFGDDYDIVWWIPAETRDLAELGLIALGDELGVAPAGDPVAGVRSELARRSRWLLVLDDAPEAGAFDDLLPEGGSGHVIVTSRAEAPAGAGMHPPPLGRIGTDDAVALLLGQVPQIDPDAAADLAELLRGEPAALQLAAAWLREAVARDRGLELGTDELTEKAVDAYRAAVERRIGGLDAPVLPACLAVTMEGLRHPPELTVPFGSEPAERGADALGRLAAGLLELCAFLAPDGIGHGLLASQPFLDALAATVEPADAAVLAADDTVLDQVLWLCVRSGTAEIVWSRGLLRIHRTVQEGLRELMGERRDHRRSAVLHALAAVVPPQVAGPVARHGALFGELRRHVPLASVAGWPVPDEPLRELVVSKVLFEATSGDPARQGRVAETVRRIADAWPPDLLTGRLLSALANLYRGLGMTREASETSERAVPLLRAAGAAGRNALLTTDRGMAYDLHTRGLFTQALGRMQELHRRSAELLGDSHRQTLFTALNRSVIEHLAGRHGAALDVARDALDVQRARAEPGDRLTGRLTHRVGELLTVTGRPDEAARLLGQQLRVMEDQHSGDVVGGLLLNHQLAVARRSSGRGSSGRVSGTSDLAKVQRQMAAVHGPEHPTTLSVTFSLAIERAEQSRTRALMLAEICRQGYTDHFSEDHPFVWLCRMGIGAFTLDDDRAVEGTAHCESAAKGLVDRLGETHPWSMAAVLHLARAYGALGQFQDAGRLAAGVASRSAELLGERHPIHRTAAGGVEAADRKVPLPVHHVDVPCT